MNAGSESLGYAQGAPLVVTFGEMLLRLSPADSPKLFGSAALRAGFGGAEANVAVALSHLGVACEYVTRLPDNLIGDAALDALRAEGVRTSHVIRGRERMGIYFIEPGGDLATARVVYDRAGSAFAEIMPRMLDWDVALKGASWLHLTGITAALGPGPFAALGSAVAAARAAGVRVSVDLNYRPLLWGDRDPLPLVEPLLHGAELVIGNLHSIRAMLHEQVTEDRLEADDGALDLSRRIADRFGCRRVALTRREVLAPSLHGWSARCYDAQSGVMTSSRRWEVGVIDRMGGGDAFAASLIAGLLRNRPEQDALEFAVAASAMKLGVPGDFNRVTNGEVESFIAGMTAAQVASGQLAG